MWRIIPRDHQISLDSKTSDEWFGWEHPLLFDASSHCWALGRMFHNTVDLSLACLFDQLIRPEEEHGRERETKGLGGLEVDDQLELRGLLHGQVRRRGAFQDVIHIGGNALSPVGH